MKKNSYMFLMLSIILILGSILITGSIAKDTTLVFILVLIGGLNVGAAVLMGNFYEGCAIGSPCPAEDILYEGETVELWAVTVLGSKKPRAMMVYRYPFENEIPVLITTPWDLNDDLKSGRRYMWNGKKLESVIKT